MPSPQVALRFIACICFVAIQLGCDSNLREELFPGRGREGIRGIDDAPPRGEAPDASPPSSAGCPNDEPCAECARDAECDDANPCTDDVCAEGECVHVDNTRPCTDDGDACTNDRCSSGTCTHPDNGTCECEGDADCDDNGTYECVKDADCDDRNLCTNDSCSGNKCTYVNNSKPCADDGLACTDDICAAGACTHPPNTAPCADDGSPCTSDVCNSGVCTHPDNGTCECANDSDCDDQVACTTESCENGQCVSGGNALENVPARCPSCDDATNSADGPTCRRYLRCYVDNGCSPHASCGGMGGICGVNTVGGGQVPHDLAVSVYDCACR